MKCEFLKVKTLGMVAAMCLTPEVAIMGADKTITLQLRSSNAWESNAAETMVVYPLNHPQYAAIREHLGDLKPGVPVMVKPFPPQDPLTQKEK